MHDTKPTRSPLIVPPGQGRAYPMGRMRAIFKADLEETDARYSVSEWSLDPHTRGPGEHKHEDDHVYYVIAGTLSVLLDGTWSQAPQGSTIIIPGGKPHNFENQSAAPTSFITFNAPGGFEARMPDIAAALSAEDLTL